MTSNVRITAPVRKRIEKQLHALCAKHGGTRGAFGYEFETPAGKLSCSPDVCANMVTLFCRYDDVDAAWRHHYGDTPKHTGTGLNPYSGKFNHHDCPQGRVHYEGDLLERAEHHLRRALCLT